MTNATQPASLEVLSDVVAFDTLLADADFAAYLAGEVDAAEDAEMLAFEAACATARIVRRLSRFDHIEKISRSQATVALVPPTL